MTAQRQDSLAAQMETVLALAVAAGCYDAHDWLKSHWGHPTNRDARKGAPSPVQPAADVLPSRCAAVGRTGQCTKMRGHGQRHRYESPTNRYVPAHVPPHRTWTKVESVPLKSGSKTFTLAVGNPCKVSGVRGMFKVISIETHPDGRVSVEVTNDRTGHSRVFRLDQIVYKRPAKKA